MTIDDILSDLRWRERSVDSSMHDLNDLYSGVKTFGYSDERLDKMIEAAEKLTDYLKEMKAFRDKDLAEKETGA